MSNPWLDIPLADYEGHMASAQVRQSEALSDLFAEALDLRLPASVAVLGVAGGNGLDRIDSERTERVVGLDINPRYLDIVRQRYSRLPGLELHCIDLAEEEVQLPPVELVHAALVFEHTGTGRCLDNALSLVAEGGALSVVLQLPGETGQNAGKGGFASTHGLQSLFVLVDPKQFYALLKVRAFELVRERSLSLPAGKAFWTGIFVRD
jgi:SAM-dependent methyltransferase